MENIGKYEFFAGMAFQALITTYQGILSEEVIAIKALKYAQEMCAALKNKERNSSAGKSLPPTAPL